MLLADGHTTPIEKIKIGDRVESTNPQSGKTRSETVTALHEHHDTDLTDLTLAAPHGRAVLHTTTLHPFWDATTGRWTPAGDLTPGSLLHTATGTTVVVTAVHTFSGHHDMRNLTVAHLHTYYVMAGTTPILVHNCADMVGAKGTQVTSQTVWLRGSYRIDVENPNPGQRPGQIHFQDQATGAKYMYNFKTGKFDGMPNSLQKQLNKKFPDYKRGISRGKTVLGL